MEARRIVLAVLLGGPLLGTLMGIAADPTMVPPPEPSWRKARPDPIFTGQPAAPAPPSHVFDAGPIELSGNWYGDHMPTWKRRAIEREIAALARLDEAAHAPPAGAQALPEPPSEAPPEPQPEGPPAFPAKVVTWPAAEPQRAQQRPLAPPAEARPSAEEDAEARSADAPTTVALGGPPT